MEQARYHLNLVKKAIFSAKEQLASQISVLYEVRQHKQSALKSTCKNFLKKDGKNSTILPFISVRMQLLLLFPLGIEIFGVTEAFC